MLCIDYMLYFAFQIINEDEDLESIEYHTDTKLILENCNELMTMFFEGFEYLIKV